MTPPTRPSRAWLLVSAAWIVPAIFAALNRVVQSRIAGWDHATAKEILFVSGDWFLYAFLTPAVFWISRRWPIQRPHLRRRIIQHFLISLVFCVAWATIGKLFQGVLALTFTAGDAQAAIASNDFWLKIGKNWLSWVFITLPFGIAVYLGEVGIEHSIRLWMEARDRDVQLARLSEQLSGARFAALQAQVNPHFLFNSLNTLAVLVAEGDNTAATRAIEQLSDVLRQTLNRRGADEVSLEEELQLSRQYLALEQLRFSDRLQPQFDIDPALHSAAVPSFAVQHLVENAVRHGIAKRTTAGRIIIAAKRLDNTLEISVYDDGPGTGDAPTFPAGHGIANTRERLRTLYGDNASLDIRGSDAGTTATLRIPYREIVFGEGELRDGNQ